MVEIYGVQSYFIHDIPKTSEGLVIVAPNTLKKFRKFVKKKMRVPQDHSTRNVYPNVFTIPTFGDG